MKYQANPFVVEAFPIIEIRDRRPNGHTSLTLEGDQFVEALPDVTARVNPRVGDYWVIHQDGFICISPKKVFEKLYRAAKGKKA